VVRTARVDTGQPLRGSVRADAGRPVAGEEDGPPERRRDRQVVEARPSGRGERPSTVSATRWRSRFGSHPKLRHNLAESVYCSAFSFATMGCDYKSSVDSIEGVLGATLLAILVAGFSNKTRY